MFSRSWPTSTYEKSNVTVKQIINAFGPKIKGHASDHIYKVRDLKKVLVWLYSQQT